MEIVTRRDEGLFPAPQDISLSCSCPDWATMCKHVAATLYGVGARLDHEPELLFMLRGVDPAEMTAAAVTDLPVRKQSGRGRILQTDEVSSVFGIDLDMGAAADSEASFRSANKNEFAAKKAAGKTRTTRKKGSG